MGAYQVGSDPSVDEAIRFQPLLARFLQQPQGEAHSFEQSVEQLQVLVGEAEQTEPEA